MSHANRLFVWNISIFGDIGQWGRLWLRRGYILLPSVYTIPKVGCKAAGPVPLAALGGDWQLHVIIDF